MDITLTTVAVPLPTLIVAETVQTAGTLHICLSRAGYAGARSGADSNRATDEIEPSTVL